MRIRQFKQLYQITFLPILFPINAYIYEEETHLTLIDIGIERMATPITTLADKLKKPIKTIILTHAHKDHVAGIDQIKSKFSEVKIYISTRDNALLNGNFTLDPNEPQEKIKGGFCKINATPDVLLYGGEQIGSLSVLLTPGHTPGSISLLDEKNGLFIAGDAFQTKGGLAISGDTRFFFPFPAMATWSKKEALNSVKKLPIRKMDVLATGHGDMMPHPANEIEKVIARMERKINQ